MAERYALGDIIAEREVLFTRATGQTETFTVRIGKPVVGTSPEEWRCPYQIQGMGRTKTFAMSGVDSVQALLLTFQVILPELDHIAKREQGKFTWLEDQTPGFPITVCRRPTRRQREV